MKVVDSSVATVESSIETLYRHFAASLLDKMHMRLSIVDSVDSFPLK
jgi:hypothetical protein